MWESEGGFCLRVIGFCGIVKGFVQWGSEGVLWRK